MQSALRTALTAGSGAVIVRLAVRARGSSPGLSGQRWMRSRAACCPTLAFGRRGVLPAERGGGGVAGWSPCNLPTQGVAQSAAAEASCHMWLERGNHRVTGFRIAQRASRHAATGTRRKRAVELRAIRRRSGDMRCLPCWQKRSGHSVTRPPCSAGRCPRCSGGIDERCVRGAAELRCSRCMRLKACGRGGSRPRVIRLPRRAECGSTQVKDPFGERAVRPDVSGRTHGGRNDVGPLAARREAAGARGASS